MKGIKWIKWRYYVGFALGLVLCFLLNFGLVKRSNAITITTNVVSTGNYWNTGTDLRCTQDYQGTISTITANQHGECNIPVQTQPIYIRNIYKNTKINTTEGNFYTFFLGYQTSDLAEQTIWNMNVPNDDWIIASWEEVTSDQMLDLCYTWYSNSTGYYCGTLESVQGWKSTYYQITLIAKHDGDTTLMLGNPSGSPRSLLIVDAGQISLSSIYEYKPADAAEKMNEKDDEDRSNIESQQGETDSSAEGSTEDLNEGTTNLIGALSSFFTTMSNVSAGNCTLPEITAYGVSLGQLNLCTYSPPTWVQTALSVIVSIIAIRLAYAIFKRVIKIVKSFTGGNG